MEQSIQAMIDDMADLVSLPDIYFRVTEVMDDPDHDAARLGEIISHDPALTAKILRVVNSAYYGMPAKIERVSRAVSIIGERELHSLLLASAAVETLNRIPNQLVNIADFWRHSVFTGIIARLLGRQCHVLHNERLFVAGLLHDIGKLVIYHHAPELAEKVLLQAAETNGFLFEAEQNILGFTHAEVGGALAQAWNLPPMLVEAVRCHHQPDQAEAHPLEAALVHIANSVVNALAPGEPVDENLLTEVPGFHPASLQTTGVRGEMLPDVVEQAAAQAGEVMDIICGS